MYIDYFLLETNALIIIGLRLFKIALFNSNSIINQIHLKESSLENAISKMYAVQTDLNESRGTKYYTRFELNPRNSNMRADYQNFCLKFYTYLKDVIKFPKRFHHFINTSSLHGVRYLDEHYGMIDR